MVNAPNNLYTAKETDMTRYGYIGLGDMGSAMAENLIRNSNDVTVYDINQKAVQEAVQHGATAATSPADVARQSDVISICVPADEHINQVLTGPEGITEGAHENLVIFIHSTVLPDTIVNAKNTMNEHNVQVFDVCVAGGATQARIGAQTVLVGGMDEMPVSGKELIRIYADEIIEAGPIGSGAALKIAVNVMTYAQFAAATTAHDLMTTTGGNPQALFKAWKHMGQLGTLTEQFSLLLDIPSEHFVGDFKEKMMTQVGISQKDLSLAMDLGWPRTGMIEFLHGIHDAMPNVYNAYGTEQ
jgi:3-hydroxyisobutyrate dehydrogenase-like beta-hydroxyacid dehydrogenase